MLVLSRKTREELYIGDEVIVTVLEIRGNKVRLGITAPLHVRVDRKEIRLRAAANAQQPPQQPSPEEAS
jgi:carbon storage regulator